MDNILKKEFKLCYSCMEKHEVQTVETEETIMYKGCNVTFRPIYEYCSNTDEYSETEELMAKNQNAMIAAYNKIRNDKNE
jgi:hypothetical protein